MKRGIVAAVIILLLTVVYAVIIATIATSHQSKSDWRWPAGEMAIEYFER